jgi:multiple antibiotic resistance protein
LDIFSTFFSFDFILFIEAFFLMFAVVDAIGSVPILISLSEGYPEHRQKIVKQAVIIAGVILVVFALFGWLIFDLFGITINDFRIAGGIVLFVTSVDHLRGGDTRAKGLEPSDVAVFPLATPLIAGPGAISTVVIVSAPPYSPFMALLVVAGNMAIAYALMAKSGWLRKALGANGSNALSRITALLIAALAVSFVVEGIAGILPTLPP